MPNNKTETSALVKLLSMFPYNRLIDIFDVKNQNVLYSGRIRDLDTDDSLTALKPDNFVIDAFDVANHTFFIYGHYDENNGD